MPDPRPPFWERYRNLLRRRAIEDVDDELRFHLDMRVDEAKRAGLSDRDAAAAAHERFGELQSIEAELLQMTRTRERRRARTEWLADLRQDVAFATRSLRRAPSFAAAAIATLAIAIGANTAIYSVVHALLLAPLPYARPDQLVTTLGWGWSNGELVAMRDQYRSTSDVAAYMASSANVDDGASAERLESAIVSSNFFSLLGSPPLVGRTFTAGESDPGRTDVIVLSEGIWRRRFAGDTAAIGRRILIDGSPRTIVGVMPNEFAFPSAKTSFWEPLVINRANAVSQWAGGGHHLVARLRPNVTLDAARREIRRFAPSIRHSNTIWDPGPEYGTRVDLAPLQEALVGTARPSLLLLLGCTAVVLLVACANVANLLLARSAARERELAVRAALGGGRWRLVRQLLAESIVLSVAGAALGLALAAAGVQWIIAAMPPGVPRASEIAMNGAALAFTASLSILTGIAFGLLPAFRATAATPSAGVTRGGRSGLGVRHQRTSAALVVGEVALAVLLSIGAELLARSFAELRHVDPGFRTTHIISARVTPPGASYKTGARVAELYETILSRLGALPGVQSLGAVNVLPLARPSYGMGARIEGQFEDTKHGLPSLDHLQFVTPGYMPTVGMRLVAGRGFSEQDRLGTEPVAIVSQSMAKRFWPNESAIGKRVGYPVESPWIRIVGVAADIRTDSLRDEHRVALYVPFAQRVNMLGPVSEMTIVARTTGDPDAIGPAIKRLVADVDRSVPVSEIRPFDDVVAESVAKPRFTLLLVGGFAVVALLLGAVGIYGVMSYLVSQRAQELSIRAALGASASDIVRMVVLRASTLSAIGAAIGIVAAVIGARPLRAMFYGVSPADPLTFGPVALLFLLVAVTASAAPARRAAKANPATTLRSD